MEAQKVKYNEKFCQPMQTVEKKDELVKTVEEYSRTKLRNPRTTEQISLDPKLKGEYIFSANHNGRNLLHTMIKIVNVLYEHGNYFYFRIEKRPHVVLLANPSNRQPGNGVIFSSAENCKPKTWSTLMEELNEDETRSTFTTFFEEFMTKSICTNGKDIFTEIASLLLFEIARRLVRPKHNEKKNYNKKYLDEIPTAPCIAICLSSDIRDCQGVFEGTKDDRKKHAKNILESAKGNEDYKKLMTKLFGEVPTKVEKITKDFSDLSVNSREHN